MDAKLNNSAKHLMLYSITYIVFAIFSIAVLTGIIIIIRNEIIITNAYRLVRKKLKAKRIQLLKINSAKAIEDKNKANLIKS